MEQFKRSQVVMLPTNEKSLNSVFTLRSDKPYLMSEQNSPFKARIYDTKDLYHTYFNLYIISDDEIKEDDWYYDNVVLQIRQWRSFMIYNKLQHKKVIATTDTSLKIDNPNYDIGRLAYINLPQPSQQFIEKYIEEYNKGNIITDVLVEYEYLLDDKTVLPYWNLKVNPKDNTITIKKLKEIYTKEELCQILEKYTSFLWNEVGIHYPISLGNDAKDKFINSEL